MVKWAGSSRPVWHRWRSASNCYGVRSWLRVIQYEPNHPWGMLHILESDGSRYWISGGIAQPSYIEGLVQIWETGTPYHMLCVTQCKHNVHVRTTILRPLPFILVPNYHLCTSEPLTHYHHINTCVSLISTSLLPPIQSLSRIGSRTCLDGTLSVGDSPYQALSAFKPLTSHTSQRYATDLTFLLSLSGLRM